MLLVLYKLKIPMPKTLIYILSILTIIITSFKSEKQSDKSEFEMKVETFINIFKSDFDESQNRRFDSKYNDIALEKNSNSIWNKTLTLKCKKTFKNNYNQTVNQTLYLGFHDFETVEKCSQTFDTLLTCLGTGCQKVNWGEMRKGFKTTPFIYLKTDKQIIFCKISCEHKNDFWDVFKYRLINEFKTDKYKIITSECGGPLLFKSGRTN